MGTSSCLEATVAVGARPSDPTGQPGLWRATFACEISDVAGDAGRKYLQHPRPGPLRVHITRRGSSAHNTTVVLPSLRAALLAGGKASFQFGRPQAGF